MTTWSEPERDLIANFVGDHVDCWEEYRAKFGFNHRSFDAIKREWYRLHPKVTV